MLMSSLFKVDLSNYQVFLGRIAKSTIRGRVYSMDVHRRSSLSVETVVLADVVTGSELRAIIGVAAETVIAQGVIVEAVVYATCQFIAEAIVQVIAQVVIHDAMHTIISYAI